MNLQSSVAAFLHQLSLEVAAFLLVLLWWAVRLLLVSIEKGNVKLHVKWGDVLVHIERESLTEDVEHRIQQVSAKTLLTNGYVVQKTDNPTSFLQTAEPVSSATNQPKAAKSAEAEGTKNGYR
jgi:hypothetical protein